MPRDPTRFLGVRTALIDRCLAVLGWVVPFALVFYLGMRGGGYDVVVRSEVTIAIWLLTLALAAAGVLRAKRLGGSAWAVLGILAALTAWTALGVIWSESAERSVEEAVRVSGYLGTFLLGLALQGRDGLRRTASAIAAAIALIALLALASRFQPSAFPTDELARSDPSNRGRLNYPLNDWNALAGLMAVGLPLLVFLASRARHVAIQALASATIPVLALVTFYSFSRSGLVGLGVGVLVFLIAAPRRLELAPSLAIAAGASTLLVLVAASRDALEADPNAPGAAGQADQMIIVTVVVCALSAVARVLLARTEVQERLRRVSLSPTITRRALAGGLVAAVIVAVVAGAPGRIADGWEDFKEPISAGGTERLEDVSGNSRYQYWEAAVDANATAPLIGIGPGTFEYWWAQHRTIVSFVRNAHSLYLETLGELGIVGLLVVVSLIVAPMVAAVGRLRGADDESRTQLAAILGAFAAFAVLAAINIVWEIAIFPTVFLLLAAAVVSMPAQRPVFGWAGFSRLDLVALLAVGALGLASLYFAGTTLLSNRAIRDSQAAARASDFDEALARAEDAVSYQGYAATPHVQLALVLQARGQLTDAADAAQEATEAEATNWRTWYTLRGIERERGDREAAREAYIRAIELNPRSPLFVIGS